MRKIKNYVVATGESPQSLMLAVEDWIAEGYEPHGSLAIDTSVEDYSEWMYQPMVKWGDSTPYKVLG